MAIPIAYLYWFSRIREWKKNEITEKEFKSCFFQWRIPKNLRYLIMKEMEKMGLIRVEKKIVYFNNFFLKENGKKEDFKDGDTRIKSPYLPKEML